MRALGTRANCWCPYSSKYLQQWDRTTEISLLNVCCDRFSYYFFNKLKFKTVWLEENGREEIPKRRIWGDFVFWKSGTNVVTKAWLSTVPSFSPDTIWSFFTRGSRKNLFECFILIFISINSFGYVDNLIQNNPLIGYKK